MTEVKEGGRNSHKGLKAAVRVGGALIGATFATSGALPNISNPDTVEAAVNPTITPTRTPTRTPTPTELDRARATNVALSEQLKVESEKQAGRDLQKQLDALRGTVVPTPTPAPAGPNVAATDVADRRTQTAVAREVLTSSDRATIIARTTAIAENKANIASSSTAIADTKATMVTQHEAEVQGTQIAIADQNQRTRESGNLWTSGWGIALGALGAAGILALAQRFGARVVDAGRWVFGGIRGAVGGALGWIGAHLPGGHGGGGAAGGPPVAGGHGGGHP